MQPNQGPQDKGPDSEAVVVAKKLALDEVVIKCAMKTSLGRRQPNKPIRDGLQAHAVCESKGSGTATCSGSMLVRTTALH
jgi:hypothetical protein